MTDLTQILDDNCVPTTELLWSKWKEILAQAGLKVLDDDSKLKDMDRVSGSQARLGFLKCTVECQVIELTVEEWSKEYAEFIANPPQENDVLTTKDGKPVKLTVELHAGHKPLVYAKAYVPDCVGEQLGWFAHSIDENTRYGWKVIMLPRTRDLIIRRFGIKPQDIPVKSVRVIRPSDSGQSLLGEVAEW